VRRSLEVEAARLAAQRRTESQLAEMRELHDRRAAAYAAGDLDTATDADLNLHRKIAEAAGNPVLLALYETLLDAVVANIRFNFEHPAEQDDHAHTALVDAIAAQDATEAMQQIDDYLSLFIGDEPVG